MPTLNLLTQCSLAVNEGDNGAYYDSCMEVNIFPSVLLFNSHIAYKRENLPMEKKFYATIKQTKTNRQNMGLQLMNINSSLDNIQFFYSCI